jgi:hypothetical protein
LVEALRYKPVTCSTPDGVTGIHHSLNPSGSTMVLVSVQRLTEMSAKNVYWRGICGQCIWLTTLPHVTTVYKYGPVIGL